MPTTIQALADGVYRKKWYWLIWPLCSYAALSMASTHESHNGFHEEHQHEHHKGHHKGHQHNHHQMQLDADGMVMHSNRVKLPKDCERISRDYQFTVHAGAKYAHVFPDKVFGYSNYQLEVEPCSRVEVTFVNQDKVRHQWMVHGLPRYLYGQGMFHLEAAGGATVKGAFIVPGDNSTYLIHCDIAQHMEKGMKAQLVVGRGSGNLWAIPGVSGDFVASNYLPDNSRLISLIVLFVATLTSAVAGQVWSHYNRREKQMQK